FKQTEITNAIQEIPRLARFHQPALAGIFPKHIIKAGFVDRYPLCVSGALEYLRVGGRRRHFHANSVTQASQESFVDHRSFVKVCGKNDQLLERHFNFFAVPESQTVHSPFEWMDPTVKQI